MKQEEVSKAQSCRHRQGSASLKFHEVEPHDALEVAASLGTRAREHRRMEGTKQSFSKPQQHNATSCCESSGQKYRVRDTGRCWEREPNEPSFLSRRPSSLTTRACRLTKGEAADVELAFLRREHVARKGTARRGAARGSSKGSTHREEQNERESETEAKGHTDD
eukprot:6211749-Pleurochrysis_carterae.AAC.2